MQQVRFWAALHNKMETSFSLFEIAEFYAQYSIKLTTLQPANI